MERECEFALQNHDVQILPESVTDEELSFQSQQALGPAKAPLSSGKLPSARIEPANRSPPKHDRRSRRKPQNHKRYTQNNLRVDKGASGTPRNPAVSPATSLTSTNSKARRGGRQEGYHLPEQDRINAEGVRRQGSCFRCFIMKEQCTYGHSPCKNCRRVDEYTKFRSWTTLCSVGRLEERCECMLPPLLATQVSVPKMRAFLKQHTGRSSRPFLLHLSIGFGEPWILWAVEISPGTHELHQMFGFYQHVDVEHHDGSPFPLTNPPVIPIWTNSLQMLVNIDCWLDKVIGDSKVSWQHHWFGCPSQAWQLEILLGICDYYYQGQKPNSGKIAALAHQTLRWALKMPVLSYIMGHAFLVPDDNVDTLFQELENRHFRAQLSHQKVSPRAANKFVKMMAFPVMRVVIERTLSGLHKLFRANVHPAELWDVIFSVVFLCLMVVRSTQTSLFQLASLSAAKNDASFSREEAASKAHTMETEFVDHIISMFHDKFRARSSKHFNPLEELGNAGQPSFSPFATHVKTMTKRHYPITSSDDVCNFEALGLFERFLRPLLPKCERVGI